MGHICWNSHWSIRSWHTSLHPVKVCRWHGHLRCRRGHVWGSVRATVEYCRSQWSSENMPDCGVRGPRFESHRGQLHVYHKHHYDIQPWARAVHPYCSALVDSAFYPPRDGKMSITISGFLPCAVLRIARHCWVMRDRPAYNKCIIIVYYYYY